MRTLGQGHEDKILPYLQYAVYGSVLLYFGRDILVPISFAVLISFVLYPVSAWLEKKGINRLAAVVISLTILGLVGLLLGMLLVLQVAKFADEWPTIQTKLVHSLSQLRQFLVDVVGVSLQEQQRILDQMSDQSGSNILSFIRRTLSASAVSLVLMIIIPVYTVLILYYRHHWVKVLSGLFPSEPKERLTEILLLTIKAYYNFIKGMALVYLIVGALNSIGLLLLGVPHAILFGFIASILTFIPYVGIMAGSLLPMAMSWITYDSIWYPLGVVGVFAFVQYLEANVIFPLAVSSRLNVNTLVTILAVVAGGILWGMAGMILFVPFAGIAKLIADRNPKWRTAALLLGAPEKE